MYLILHSELRIQPNLDIRDHQYENLDRSALIKRTVEPKSFGKFFYLHRGYFAINCSIYQDSSVCTIDASYFTTVNCSLKVESTFHITLCIAVYSTCNVRIYFNLVKDPNGNWLHSVSVVQRSGITKVELWFLFGKEIVTKSIKVDQTYNLVYKERHNER